MSDTDAQPKDPADDAPETEAAAPVESAADESAADESVADEAAADEAGPSEAAADPAGPSEAAQGEAAADASAPAESGAGASVPAEPVVAPAADAREAVAAAGEAPGSEVLIEAEGLCKYYGAFTAIEDVSFEVRRGQVVAFLGCNGAGKSTTMKILTGVIAPDLGEARIAGLSVIHNRIDVARRLGYLPENGPLYDEMTPGELLRFFGEARGMDGDMLERRAGELSERLALQTVLGKPISKLSKGFRQRVGLAQALLHEPDVLIMDEPTSGLDPNQIRDVRRIIREFGQDRAILLSTHILQEVEAIADHVVFIHQGRVVFTGTVDELRSAKAADGDLEAAFAQHTSYVAGSWAS